MFLFDKYSNIIDNPIQNVVDMTATVLDINAVNITETAEFLIITGWSKH